MQGANPVCAEGANTGAQPYLKAAATSGAEAVGRRLQWLVIIRSGVQVPSPAPMTPRGYENSDLLIIPFLYTFCAPRLVQTEGDRLLPGWLEKEKAGPISDPTSLVIQIPLDLDLLYIPAAYTLLGISVPLARTQHPVLTGSPSLNPFKLASSL